MKINITFFIQIINFFVTYYILHTFLFKKVVLLLQTERNKTQKVVRKTQEVESLARSQAREKKEELLFFKNQFLSTYHLPALKQENLDIKAHYMPEKKYILSMSEKAKNILVAQLPNVD